MLRLAVSVGIVRATELDISLFTISSEGVGESIGSVRAVDTDQGLEIFPSGRFAPWRAWISFTRKSKL